MSSQNPSRIKLDTPDGLVLVKLSESCKDYSALCEAIAKKQISLDGKILQFFDDEGDALKLADDEDLEYALSFCEGPALRLRLVDLSELRPTDTARPAADEILSVKGAADAEANADCDFPPQAKLQKDAAKDVQAETAARHRAVELLQSMVNNVVESGVLERRCAILVHVVENAKGEKPQLMIHTGRSCRVPLLKSAFRGTWTTDEIVVDSEGLQSMVFEIVYKSSDSQVLEDSNVQDHRCKLSLNKRTLNFLKRSSPERVKHIYVDGKRPASNSECESALEIDLDPISALCHLQALMDGTFVDRIDVSVDACGDLLNQKMPTNLISLFADSPQWSPAQCVLAMHVLGYPRKKVEELPQEFPMGVLIRGLVTAAQDPRLLPYIHGKENCETAARGVKILISHSWLKGDVDVLRLLASLHMEKVVLQELSGLSSSQNPLPPSGELRKAILDAKPFFERCNKEALDSLSDAIFKRIESLPDFFALWEAMTTTKIECHSLMADLTTCIEKTRNFKMYLERQAKIFFKPGAIQNIVSLLKTVAEDLRPELQNIISDFFEDNVLCVESVGGDLSDFVTLLQLMGRRRVHLLKVSLAYCVSREAIHFPAVLFSLWQNVECLRAECRGDCKAFALQYIRQKSNDADPPRAMLLAASELLSENAHCDGESLFHNVEDVYTILQPLGVISLVQLVTAASALPDLEIPLLEEAFIVTIRDSIKASDSQVHKQALQICIEARNLQMSGEGSCKSIVMRVLSEVFEAFAKHLFPGHVEISMHDVIQVPVLHALLASAGAEPPEELLKNAAFKRIRDMVIHIAEEVVNLKLPVVHAQRLLEVENNVLLETISAVLPTFESATLLCLGKSLDCMRHRGDIAGSLILFAQEVGCSPESIDELRIKHEEYQTQMQNPCSVLDDLQRLWQHLFWDGVDMEEIELIAELINCMPFIMYVRSCIASERDENENPISDAENSAYEDSEYAGSDLHWHDEAGAAGSSWDERNDRAERWSVKLLVTRIADLRAEFSVQISNLNEQSLWSEFIELFPPKTLGYIETTFKLLNIDAGNLALLSTCSAFLDKLKIVENVANIITRWGGETPSTLACILAAKGRDDEHLKHVESVVREINSSFSFSEVQTRFLQSLSNVEEDAVAFLSELVWEDHDLRHLVNAVDDYGDQFIRADTVAALIDIKQHVAAPLCRNMNKLSIDTDVDIVIATFGTYVDDMLEALDGDPKESMKKVKLVAENYQGLQRLWRGMANRTEVTRESVKAAINEGTFIFEATTESNLSISLIKAGSLRVNFEGLSDLSSRALLLASCESGEPEDRDRMHLFAKKVDLVLMIMQVLLELRHEGCLMYRRFELRVEPEPSGSEKLEQLLVDVKRDLTEWRDALMATRRQRGFILTFFHSRQLWWLWEYFFPELDVDREEAIARPNSSTTHVGKGRNKGLLLKQVVSQLLSMLHTTLDLNVQQAVRGRSRLLPQPSQRDSLELLANALYKVLMQSAKWINPVRIQLVSGKSVHAGQVQVLAVETNQLSLRALMTPHAALGKFPCPHQVLLCRSCTGWAQIEAFLARCFVAHQHDHAGILFTMANCETLSFKLQHQLVRRVKLAQKEGLPFHLSLVCIQGDNLHILDELPFESGCIISVAEARSVVYNTLAARHRKCMVLTSEVAGLGKTEAIKEMAHEETPRKEIQTLPIQGNIDLLQVVDTLMSMPHSDQCSLHVDVTNQVTDTQLLSDLLFEIVVLGHVVADDGSVAACMHDSIYIELANVGVDFVHELPVCNFFPVKNLQSSMIDFVGTRHPQSPLQIVARVLERYDSGTLDDAVISLQDNERIPTTRCIALLNQHVLRSSVTQHTWVSVNTVVNILASQLACFAATPYLSPKVLRDLKIPVGARSEFVENLLKLAFDFLSNMGVLAPNSVRRAADERARSLPKWEASNHVMMMFHASDPERFSVIYRDTATVPDAVKTLLSSQGCQLPDYASMDSEQLKHQLDMLLVEPDRLAAPETDTMLKYRLTLDNFLKIIHIKLRLEAKIPVVLMGETGCGKTSLVKFMAGLYGILFHCLNIHAGTTQDDIIRFLSDVLETAQKDNIGTQLDPNQSVALDSRREHWVFFDEINTCECLGLLKTIIVDRMFSGQTLPSNVSVLAACNPYRLKNPTVQDQHPLTALPLRDQQPAATLVYLVRPLPDALLNYTWNFGSVQGDEERNYIEQMVYNQHSDEFAIESIVAACYESHCFLRANFPDIFVSMRDVARTLDLLDWFSRHRPDIPRGAERRATEALVLALAVSYHIRIPDENKRTEYIFMLSRTMRDTWPIRRQFAPWWLAKIVEKEKEEYLDRMEIPEGIVPNDALLENVFACVVCICNRIPLFVVGPPGCSKTQAMRLIEGNLKGKVSRNPWFRTLPEVWICSFQGSESSTSEGIKKVFQKADEYLKEHRDGRVQPVVLLDEVGLAEISPHNPLKVLHSLLEPDFPKIRPDVSVVGISNWSLDAAKMNRAIYIHRPPPETDDLIATAEAIMGEDMVNSSPMLRKFVTHIAEGYFDYIKLQQVANLHGLRDFFSLLKSLKRYLKVNFTCKQTFYAKNAKKILADALFHFSCRNFGGLPNSTAGLHAQNVLNYKDTDLCYKFMETGKCRNEKKCRWKHDVDMRVLWLEQQGQRNVKFWDLCYWDQKVERPIPRLQDSVAENLEDEHARHLLLATRLCENDAISLVQVCAAKLKRHCRVFIGSRFAQDQTDKYRYSMLSKIMVAMESGQVLILKDLNAIHGSLYDMLNQSYIVVGGKKNCRIALGPFQNPLCSVDERFRCVVLVESDQIGSLDPPFLNRFEKQHVALESLLDAEQREVVKQLENWIASLEKLSPASTSVPDSHDRSSHFRAQDLFIGYGREMLHSLVRGLWASHRDNIEHEVQRRLLYVASFDGVLRASLSDWAKVYPKKYDTWKAAYMNILEGSLSLSGFLEWLTLEPPAIARCVLVTTCSNTHLNIENGAAISSVQSLFVHNVDAFTSEADLEICLNHFFSVEASGCKEHHVLFLHCHAESSNITITKYSVDNRVDRYMSAIGKPNAEKTCCYKHVVVLLHGSRELFGSPTYHQAFNFPSGWEQRFVSDLVDVEDASFIKSVMDCESIQDVLLANGPYPFFKVFEDVVQRAVWTINFPKSEEGLEHAAWLVRCVPQDKELLSEIYRKLLSLWEETPKLQRNLWRTVVCSRNLLFKQQTLAGSLKSFVQDVVYESLSKILCRCEAQLGAISTLLRTKDQTMRDVWFNTFHTNVDLQRIPHPSGQEAYPCVYGLTRLRLPFSRLWVEKLDDLSGAVAQHLSLYLESPPTTSEQILNIRQLRIDIENAIGTPAWTLANSHAEDYYKDVISTSVSARNMPFLLGLIRTLRRRLRNFNIRRAGWIQRACLEDSEYDGWLKVSRDWDSVVESSSQEEQEWLDVKRGEHVYVLAEDSDPAWVRVTVDDADDIVLLQVVLVIFKDCLDPLADLFSAAPEVLKWEPYFEALREEPTAHNMGGEIHIAVKTAVSYCANHLLPTTPIVASFHRGLDAWADTAHDVSSHITRLNAAVGCVRTSNNDLSHVVLEICIDMYQQLLRRHLDEAAISKMSFLVRASCVATSTIAPSTVLNDFRVLLLASPMLEGIDEKRRREFFVAVVCAKLVHQMPSDMDLLTHALRCALADEKMPLHLSVLLRAVLRGRHATILDTVNGSDDGQVPEYLHCCHSELKACGYTAWAMQCFVDAVEDLLGMFLSQEQTAHRMTTGLLERACRLLSNQGNRLDDLGSAGLCCVAVIRWYWRSRVDRVCHGDPLEDAQHTVPNPELKRIQQLFFLRLCRQRMSLCDLRSRCQTDEWRNAFSILDGWTWGSPFAPPAIARSFEYNVLANLKGEVATKVIDTLSRLSLNRCQSEQTQALEVLTQVMADAQTSPTACTAVLAAVAYIHFLENPQRLAVKSALQQWCESPQVKNQSHVAECHTYLTTMFTTPDVRSPFMTGGSAPTEIDKNIGMIVGYFVSSLISTLPRANHDRVSSGTGKTFFHCIMMGLCKDSYWPGLPDSEEVAIFQALGSNDGNTRHRCVCGYTYIVGACGRPLQASSCPECHSPLGDLGDGAVGGRRLDLSPITAPTAAKLATKGYIRHDVSPEDMIRVRNMTPLASTMLHLLVHAALVGAHWLDKVGLVRGPGTKKRPLCRHHQRGFCELGAACGFAHGEEDNETGGDASAQTRPSEQAAAQESMRVVPLSVAWTHVMRDWAQLGPLVPAQAHEDGGMAISAALVSIIGSLLFEETDKGILPDPACLCHIGGRQLWETAWQELVQSIPAKVPELLRQMRWGTSSAHGASLSMTADEILLEDMTPPTYDNMDLANFFGVGEKASLVAMERCFFAQAGEVTTLYPALASFFTHQSKLKLMSCLRPLLELSEKVRLGCLLRFGRAFAETTSIEEALQKGNLESAGISRDTEPTSVLEDFAAAWRRCKEEGCMRYLGCQPLEDPPDVNPSARLSLLCVDRSGAGRFLAAAFESFARSQNEFLQYLLEAVRAPGAAVIHHTQRSLPKVRIQQSHWWNIIGSFNDLAASLLQYSAFGEEGQLVFDWARMEASLESVFFGRDSALAELDVDSLEDFAFAGEAFRRDAELASAVAKCVIQEELPQKTMESLSEDEHGQVSCGSTIRENLDVLELLLSYIHRVRPDPSENLRQFCSRWALDVPRVSDSLRVSHALALHDYYEQREGRYRVLHLDDCFREHLPVTTAEACLDHWRANFGKLADAVVKIFHRLVVRFLSSGAPLPCTLNTPILELLESSMVDNGLAVSVSEAFPASWEVYLKHTQAAYNAALKARESKTGFQ